MIDSAKLDDVFQGARTLGEAGSPDQRLVLLSNFVAIAVSCLATLTLDCHS